MLRILLVFVGVAAATDRIKRELETPFEVLLEPSTQKVVENSRVLFTCFSSHSDVAFRWSKPVRAVDEEKDEVTIIQVGANISVLSIERAHLKKHKRTFRCTAYNKILRKSRFAEAVLKVMPFTRLHKFFPHILPISSAADIMLPSSAPGTADMMCKTTISSGTRNRPEWRWIKDGRIDLSLTSDYETERIHINENGLLHISELRETDTGTYMCVATNQRGTAYGTPFQMNVTMKTETRRIVNGTCVMKDGVVMNYGNEYNPSGDPCHTCKCVDNGGFACRTVRCAAPQCGGRKYVMSREECCKYTCLDTSEAVTDHDEKVHCTSYNGSHVHVGEGYQVDSDPCKTCTCSEEGSPVSCSMIMCDAPQCRNYKLIPGTCCGFTCPEEESEMCTDRDGERWGHGEFYMPAEDPCIKCSCEHGRKGRCMMVACDRPTCENYVTSRDTCCNYTCPKENSSTTSTCEAYNGEVINDGDDYQPNSDACTHCTCTKGKSAFCRSVSCIPEPMPCSDPLPVPGVCCKFTCEQPTRLQDKVLGRVFVQQIGSRNAFVQWKIPENYVYRLAAEQLTNLTVYYFNESMIPTGRVHVPSGSDFAILEDLDPNDVYYVMVNGTSRDRSAVMMTRPARFVLDGRAGSSFILGNSLSQVFQSHGDIAYDGYTLPQPFIAVGREPDIRTALNFDTFQRVDITTYNEAPCPNQNCGMLRFYMYSPDGQARNVMSLMFADRKDFAWARAHL